MSRISEVIKNKNIAERKQKARQRDEMTRLKDKAAFNANLSEAMKVVETLLDSGDVKSVTIQVPDNMLANFGEAIYTEIMAGYIVEQIDGEPDKFNIRFNVI